MLLWFEFSRFGTRIPIRAVCQAHTSCLLHDLSSRGLSNRHSSWWDSRIRGASPVLQSVCPGVAFSAFAVFGVQGGVFVGLGLYFCEFFLELGGHFAWVRAHTHTHTHTAHIQGVVLE